MIYRLKVTLPQSKVFYRTYAIRPEMTLFKFHSFISNDLVFDPDQMVFFDGRDANDCRKGRYCLFDMGDGSMDQVTFKQLVARGEVAFRYYFDLQLKRYLLITFEGEENDNPKLEIPCLLEGKGVNPDQFSGKYEDPEPVDFSSRKARVTDDDIDDEGDEDDDEDEDEDDDEEDEDGKLLVDEEFGK